ncbi:MAG: prolyl oligopeptidase family serine peptidase [Planctomycetaceae bacterium]
MPEPIKMLLVNHFRLQSATTSRTTSRSGTAARLLTTLLHLTAALVSSAIVQAQPPVLRDRVDVNWFDRGTRFWYSINVAEGGHEFVLVNAETGTRQSAFDHSMLARQFSEQIGKPFDATHLPVRSLDFERIPGDIVLSGSAGLWQLSADGSQLQKLDERSDSQQATFFLPPRRSVDRGGEMELRLINRLKTDVQLIWMNRDGSELSYGTIRPSEEKTQHTFEGHIWLLKTDNTVRACFEAAPIRRLVEISEDHLKDLRTEQPPSRRSSRPRAGKQRSKTVASPDGVWQADVRDHNLWIESAEKEPHAPQQLTTDATADNSFHRSVQRARLVHMDYDAVDFPDTLPDAHWSPTSQHLLAFQTTVVPERIVTYVISSPKDSLQPKLGSYPYAKPGDELPIARPRLFSITDEKEIPISGELFANSFELRFLKWSADGSRFWMLHNERGHQRMRILEVLAADGSVRTIVDEHSETFLHYSSEGKFVLEWLPGDELLWASERSGWNHLYRYSLADGSIINPLTTGEWNVRRIEKIDPVAGVVWFFAVGILPGQNPYHEHFCRVRMDGSDLKVLTAGDGTHEISLSPDRRWFVDRWSRVDLAPVTELRRSDTGAAVVELEQADASDLIRDQGRLPARFVAKGRDGQTDIWGIIHFPKSFDPKRTYPVVENIYAGPHDHHVPVAFRSSYRHQQQITDREMFVVQIDGMGTAWRSKEFHDVCWKNLKDAGIPDRIAWMRSAAEQYPSMDLTAVGIYGGSAGGQNAMAALLWHGDFYQAAVADCGCHDNRMDKLWWNEQWMGWPVDESWAENSNTEHAGLLTGQLMLVVGEQDRNVDPATTTQVVDALIKAGRDFTFLPMPGHGHGACESPYAAKRRADFLERHLRK